MVRRVLLLLSLLMSAVSLAAEAPSRDVRTYDPNPSHLWNRLHRTLFVREAPDGAVYGEDRIDPLFWGSTRHLLEGESHRRAVAVLDEFLNNHGEKLLGDPLRRAFLQHDLWALFDWSDELGHAPRYTEQKRALRLRLAQAMSRLALTGEEIESLPDNYARAIASSSLPRGLFLKDGDWVNVTSAGRAAPRHAAHFGGRSIFHVLVRLPAGRDATRAYLAKLGAFVDAAADRNALEHALPEFPLGTQWALVRRMQVIDADGNRRSTPIIESIEIRRHAEIDAQQTLAFFVSRMSAGDLREVQPGERDFFQFQSHDTDPFELSAEALGRFRGPNPFRNQLQRDVLRSCALCHGGSGIRSVQSLFRVENGQLLFTPRLTEADPASSRL